MFKLKIAYNNDEKIIFSELIKNKLEQLPSQIKEIKFFQVGINVSKSERAYDMVLVSEFNNLEDLNIYAKHPAHVEFIDFFSQYRENSIVTDFVL